MAYSVVKIDNKVNHSEIFLKEKFSHINIDRISRYLGDYLKKLIVPDTTAMLSKEETISNDTSESTDILQ